MRAILNKKWLVVIAWIVGIVLLIWQSPDMEELIREKGQITVPEGSPSERASQLLARMSEQDGSSAGVQTALVFHSDDRLSDSELTEIKRAVGILKDNKASLHITNITTHFDERELEETLVSEDGRTVLVSLSVDLTEREPAEVKHALFQALENISVPHYFTGGWIIDEDVIKSSQEGLKRTEWITVIFILVVLLIVFRSVVSPLIPLIAVGISYITSAAIVAFLVEFINFPLSNFTQIFLVAVLFGIGTDYCILLLSRFKEELPKANSVNDAIVETYRTAGKTVFYSALAVFVGFAAIGFSTFKLYQSAAAVAIGVAVLFLALVTIVPFFMSLFGRKLFWPTRKSLEHKDSKLWEWAGKLSLTRPLRALLIVAIVAIPFLILYDGDVSFNSLDELGDSYASVKGFNIIAESFGPGESLPAKIVLEHDEKMDTPEYLALIEKISREVLRIDGIKSVRSATRPVGEEIEQLFVKEQVNVLEEGLDEGRDGLTDIGTGLTEASTAITDSLPDIEKATDGVGELINGTVTLKQGIDELGSGLSQLEKGLHDGSVGANQLKRGLREAQSSAEQLAAGGRQLLQGYTELRNGLEQLSGHYRQVEQQLSQFGQALNNVKLHLQTVAERYPELQQDPDYLSALGIVQHVHGGVGQIQSGLSELTRQLSQIESGLAQANAGLTDAINGQQQFVDGLKQLTEGMAELQVGIERAAQGQRQIIGELPHVNDGLDRIKIGQEQLKTGFSSMGEQLKSLTEGLDEGAHGLELVASGLGEAAQYLRELAEAPDDEMTGWFIPEDVLSEADFQRVFDTYMSDDRRMTTFDVIFEGNPYAVSSIDKVDEINEAIERAIKGTKLEDATYGVSGVTSIYHDLDMISKQDYARTVVIVLLCLTLILVVLFRSFIMPMYLIASLLLTYYTAMGMTEIVFVDILGYPGLNWPVPFFAFVILVALGIDYSIFLMDRFNEYEGMTVKERLLLAMRKMGTVIISAVVILGGTFAAMLPSGVLSLLQIATTVISGLLLYAGLFLPFFVPVMVRTFGEANWWPFIKQS